MRSRCCVLLLSALVAGCLSDPQSNVPDGSSNSDAPVADATMAIDAPVIDAPIPTDAMPDAVQTINTHSLQYASDGILYLNLGRGNVDMAITFEIWFKLASLPNVGQYYALVVKGIRGQSGNESYAFELYNDVTDGMTLIARMDGTPVVGGGDEQNSRAFRFEELSPGNWYHVAISYGIEESATLADRFAFYVNGVPVPEANEIDLSGNSEPLGTIHQSEADTTFGYRDEGSVVNRINGLVDEIRLWGVVRTPGQIAAHYNTELTGNDDGLLGYWPLEGNDADSSDSNWNLSQNGMFSYQTTDKPF